AAVVHIDPETHCAGWIDDRAGKRRERVRELILIHRLARPESAVELDESRRRIEPREPGRQLEWERCGAGRRQIIQTIVEQLIHMRESLGVGDERLRSRRDFRSYRDRDRVLGVRVEDVLEAE